VTATAAPEEELTPLDDWMVLEELDAVPLLVDVEAVLDDAADPGIVCALTTAKTPTPTMAAIVLPTVRRSSSLRASSRIRARARASFVGSMLESLAQRAKSYLRAGCEVPESGSVGCGYTLIQFNARRLRNRKSSPRSSVAQVARRAH
jgi:hypothetical protein